MPAHRGSVAGLRLLRFVPTTNIRPSSIDPPVYSRFRSWGLSRTPVPKLWNSRVHCDGVARTMLHFLVARPAMRGFTCGRSQCNQSVYNTEHYASSEACETCRAMSLHGVSKEHVELDDGGQCGGLHRIDAPRTRMRLFREAWPDLLNERLQHVFHTTL